MPETSVLFLKSGRASAPPARHLCNTLSALADEYRRKAQVGETAQGARTFAARYDFARGAPLERGGALMVRVCWRHGYDVAEVLTMTRSVLRPLPLTQDKSACNKVLGAVPVPDRPILSVTGRRYIRPARTDPFRPPDSVK